MTARVHTRPPRRASGALDAVAVIYWVLACLIGLVTVLEITSMVADPGGSSTREMVGLVIAMSAAIALIWTGLGLRRRRRAAFWWAVAEASAFACGGVFLAFVLASRDPGDGAAYTFMGGVLWTGIGLACLVTLLLPGTIRGFRPPPPGWYPDPTRAAAWRLWDGTKWTDQSADQ